MTKSEILPNIAVLLMVLFIGEITLFYIAQKNQDDITPSIETSIEAPARISLHF